MNQNERTNVSYVRSGDYLFPALELTKNERAIGVWGNRRLNYPREHRKTLYVDLMFSGKLNDHLANINEQAEEMFEHLMTQMAKMEGITERLKEEDQLLWIAKMSMIHERAADIVNHDLIYA